MFLKLTIAGHMTIYLARTGEKPFWSKPYPAWPLIVTTELTQVVATLFAVYGVFMNPLGWPLALFVWGFAFVFFLLNDFVKIKFDKLLDHANVKFKRR